jgi:hypothetical protein
MVLSHGEVAHLRANRRAGLDRTARRHRLDRLANRHGSWQGLDLFADRDRFASAGEKEAGRTGSSSGRHGNADQQGK